MKIKSKSKYSLEVDYYSFNGPTIKEVQKIKEIRNLAQEAKEKGNLELLKQIGTMKIKEN